MHPRRSSRPTVVFTLEYPLIAGIASNGQRIEGSEFDHLFSLCRQIRGNPNVTLEPACEHVTPDGIPYRPFAPDVRHYLPVIYREADHFCRRFGLAGKRADVFHFRRNTGCPEIELAVLRNCLHRPADFLMPMVAPLLPALGR